MLGIRVIEPYGTRHGTGPNDWKFGDAGLGSNTPAMFDQSCLFTCTYPCDGFSGAPDDSWGFFGYVGAFALGVAAGWFAATKGY